LSKAEELVHEETEAVEENVEVEVNAGLEVAIELYRKIKEGKEPSEELLKKIEKEIEIIRNRETITKDSFHEPIEVKGKGKVLMGPPTLTRFEKARITGARTLQLSQGAPPFIQIPKTATTSLDIAMEELDKKVIPITIRRVYPNGDFQNIPIGDFISE